MTRGVLIEAEIIPIEPDTVRTGAGKVCFIDDAPGRFFVVGFSIGKASFHLDQLKGGLLFVQKRTRLQKRKERVE